MKAKDLEFTKMVLQEALRMVEEMEVRGRMDVDISSGIPTSVHQEFHMRMDLAEKQLRLLRAEREVSSHYVAMRKLL